MPTPGEWATIAWAALAAKLGARFLLWWDRQGPPAGPSVFDQPDQDQEQVGE